MVSVLTEAVTHHSPGSMVLTLVVFEMMFLFVLLAH